MANFKFVINDPESRRAFQVEIDQSKALDLIGKKIKDEFSGDIVGLPGYTLQITGGTDKDGFPMHPSVKGPGRKRVLLSSPPGFHPRLKGQRKRKTVRGDTISEDIIQINCKVVKKGEKSLEELLPTKPKEKEEEAKETKEEKKEPETKAEESELVGKEGGEGSSKETS